ncbi:uncharacterized protein DUF3592 [Nocardiopsis sp. Huas11]|uniref:DUF3592 domain-containing protein n=1 Tax=Nocardiopsis sp. Huas11 TaxID=2183912 RepID=UPI000EAC9BF0|nr:DUF3592 domain-containing protein [Nocardiopsis sp. Huas11]RKS05394.1 uncharacterized protein DUF3592 [Nocardiopsis sp. Huas11]
MDDFIGPLLAALFLGLTLYHGVRGVLARLRRRREQRELDETGVRAYGHVSRVHPLERSPHGHTVTVTVQGADGTRWEAVDSSGLGGYHVREGTPVSLVHSPADPRLIRVERAAHADPARGDYPVGPRRRPGDRPSLLVPLLPLVGVLVIGGVVLLAVRGGDSVVGVLVPGLFVVVGPCLIVGGVVAMARGRVRARRHTAETVGVVTDTWTQRKRRRSSNGPSRTIITHPFTVHFRAADGREVHRRYPVSTSSFRPALQQRVRIRHDPGHPAEFSVADLSAGDLFTGLTLMFIGTVFTLIGGFVGFVMARSAGL